MIAYRLLVATVGLLVSILRMLVACARASVKEYT